MAKKTKDIEIAPVDVGSDANPETATDTKDTLGVTEELTGLGDDLIAIGEEPDEKHTQQQPEHEEPAAHAPSPENGAQAPETTLFIEGLLSTGDDSTPPMSTSEPASESTGKRKKGKGGSEIKSEERAQAAVIGGKLVLGTVLTAAGKLLGSSVTPETHMVQKHQKASAIAHARWRAANPTPAEGAAPPPVPMGLPIDINWERLAVGDVEGAMIREVSMVMRVTSGNPVPVRFALGKTVLAKDERPVKPPIQSDDPNAPPVQQPPQEGDHYILIMPADVSMVIAAMLAGKGDGAADKLVEFVKKYEDEIRMLIALGMAGAYGYDVYADIAGKK